MSVGWTISLRSKQPLGTPFLSSPLILYEGNMLAEQLDQVQNNHLEHLPFHNHSFYMNEFDVRICSVD